MFTPSKIQRYFLYCFIVMTSAACSKDSDDSPTTPNEPDSNTNTNCTDVANYIFNEQNALLLVECENTVFASTWALINDTSNATGTGYLINEAQNNAPGSNLSTYQLQINTVGTYRFIWRSAVKEGTNSTEANDTWLRFADASDFYGLKSSTDHIVYPNGVGKTPIPNGSSSDGWFKIYRSGNDLDFKWQAKTSDNDSHDIYVQFDTPGIYTMEISGRSKGHAIDKFLLFQPTLYTENEATALDTFSAITCQ
ncbi:hypothetical protein [Olleya sp. HaHaR_3_96]|uniref:hypothetical protein n=1 Tax=Olleya sp. HaHaR_3_96 TaxID=2745560 RepID=UPI001C4FD101|nr:hypothetical protein [Olleya sp. HaHaR_3_96]QXP60873.1 hypothetical protein H0I26_04335 [Olleya sp. HaHaR_3_96]